MRYVPPTNVTNLTISLHVRDDLHQKEAFSEVELNIAEEPYAYLSITRISPSPLDPIEGETVTIKVTVRNTGKINATRVGIQLYLDKVRGNPIAIGVIDAIAPGQFESVDIFWQASGAGTHRIVGAVVQCSERFKTPHTVEAPYRSPQFKVEGKAVVDVVNIAAGVIVGFVVLGVVGYLVKRKRDQLAIKREQERTAAEPGVAEAGAAGAGSAASAQTQAQLAEELYARDREAAAAATYAPAAQQARVYPCPRCGKPTDEEGLLCLECNARDSIESARKAVGEAGELALDVESAEEMLRRAEEEFKAGKFADAVESATGAEDEARSARDAFERASAYALGKERAIATEIEEAPAPPPKPGAPPAPAPVLTIRPRPPAPAATETAGAAPARCPKCGRETRPNWRICPSCQTKLQ